MRLPEPPKNTHLLFLWLLPLAAATLLWLALAVIGWSTGAVSAGSAPFWQDSLETTLVAGIGVLSLSAALAFLGTRAYRQEWLRYDQHRAFCENGSAELLSTRRALHREVRAEVRAFLQAQRQRAVDALRAGITEAQRRYAGELSERFALAAKVLRVFRGRIRHLEAQVEDARAAGRRFTAEHLAAFQGDLRTQRRCLDDATDAIARQKQLVEGEVLRLGHSLQGEIDDLRRRAVLAGENFELPEALHTELENRVREFFTGLSTQYAPDVITFDNQRKIKLIEKRLSKLAGSLDNAEARIVELANRSFEDGGVPSIYRGVQGLSREDKHFKRKNGFLRNIFEANLALQKHRSPDQNSVTVAKVA